MKTEKADDVFEKIREIVLKLELGHINPERIKCFRSFGSTSNAHARIYSMPKIWQKALGIEPCYVIEVLSEKWDKMDEGEKERTLIHELMHIPNNFSGALLSHKAVHFDGKGGHKTRRIDSRLVNKLWKKMKE